MSGFSISICVNESEAYTGFMASVICKVQDIGADERRWLEGVVGRPLLESQQVVIQVIETGVEPSIEQRNASLAEAAEIARWGRANAAAQDVTNHELEAVINEALRQTRSQAASTWPPLTT